MSDKIKKIEQINFQIPVESPFLACMHHIDHYPKGNKDLGPAVSLAGRNIGQDFSGKDGFSMYHGEVVPGFPAHPHRGFETVTIVSSGIVDHFDSKGAKGRYGNGDVQWLTTGAGCQHSEMFPLIHSEADNPLDLFQIWLNLPAKSKFVEPDYKMLWSEDIPTVEIKKDDTIKVIVKVISGSFSGVNSLPPTKASWANEKNNRVNILLMELTPDAVIELPALTSTINRNLYFYEGNGSIKVEGERISPSSRVKLAGDEEISIVNETEKSYILVLEGEPINEPVAQYGPFVMNTAEEIQQAFADYRKTGFGGWPWESDDITNEKNQGRFAKHSDGRIENRE